VTLTLARPHALNALSPSVFAELGGYIAEIADDGNVACVVLRGEGRCFSAGNDLKAIQRGEVAPHRWFQADVIDSLEALPQPTIAAVHSYCYTGALELALACDLILCSEDAQFTDTHAQWGMVPSWGMAQRLGRRIGPSRSKYLMFSGRALDGRRAADWGLAVECVPNDAFDAAVDNLAGDIASRSLHSLNGIKRFATLARDHGQRDALALERSSHPGHAPDMQERLSRGWARQ